MGEIIHSETFYNNIDVVRNIVHRGLAYAGLLELRIENNDEYKHHNT